MRRDKIIMPAKRKQIVLRPIGAARTDEEKGIFQIIIQERFRPALKELDKYTHVNVLWWAHQSDTAQKRRITQVDKLPPFYGNDAPTMGIFATRSEYRPNPIALTSVQIVKIDHTKGIIDLNYFDALDGTPIVDLKPYLPMTDLIQTARYPKYLQHWPKNNEDAAAWWISQLGESA